MTTIILIFDPSMNSPDTNVLVIGATGKYQNNKLQVLTWVT